MRHIQLTLAALLAGLTLLWLQAEPGAGAALPFFTLRAAMMNYTGILGIGVMSVGMLLALRPVRLEPWLGGLDKAYRLHKWLGVSGLVIAIVHWAWAKVPKWAVGWGWLEKPRRGPRPEETVEIFRILREQRHLAEEIGEWAFYAVVILIALALIKRFPYRYFFQTHRLMAVVYLVLVFHSVVLMNFGYWSHPVGPVMALLMAGGSVAAVASLRRQVGASRRTLGTIEALVRHPDNQVLKVAIRLQGRWPGHAAGQFAFVTFDAAEGAHPFTISSAWQGDGRISFLIKGLGDYTRQLPDTLAVGQPVTVEGPYGRFSFAGGKARQVWVAGGIGITPFIARMQALVQAPDGRAVDLFYCTSAPDEGFIGKLRQLASQAGVGLHVLVSPRDGRLDAAGIAAAVPGWQAADFWFCGPTAFGSALRAAFCARGLRTDDFHQELFEMR